MSLIPYTSNAFSSIFLLPLSFVNGQTRFSSPDSRSMTLSGPSLTCACASAPQRFRLHGREQSTVEQRHMKRCRVLFSSHLFNNALISTILSFELYNKDEDLFLRRLRDSKSSVFDWSCPVTRRSRDSQLDACLVHAVHILNSKQMFLFL